MIQVVSYALYGGLFCFLFTILGAAIVFFFKKINQNIMDSLLSFSAGIMISAAFFSLLNPAIDLAIKQHQNIYISVLFGFMFGGCFIFLCNKFFSNLPKKNFSLKRCLLLITSITLHNIPEGLAVGVAFGTILYGGSLISAITLTLGIAIQNFPEGAIISMPLKSEGMSKSKAFLYGTLSGIVEPIGAVLTILLTNFVVSILPYLLSFAAGSMIYVVVEELIPESQSGEHSNIGTIGVAIGFVIMMILDVALG